MKILIIGSGAREHAMVENVLKNERVKEVFIAPGNDGMGEIATCIPIPSTDIETLGTFAQDQDIDLTIVGNEDPLVAGIADEFKKRGLLIFGPDKEAARIEGSKSFMKEVLKENGVATAAYQVINDLEAGLNYLNTCKLPIVLKADGLAAGKGVIICEEREESRKVLKEMLNGSAFGDAGREVVIEEFLEGEEFSLMAFVHGDKVYPMITAKDYKKRYDGDQGPNTGGMGAYAPVFLGQNIYDHSVEMIRKTASGLLNKGCPFTGFLYGGFMLTKEGPKIIEFNARMGDPETEVLLPLMENNLVDIILDILGGIVPDIRWKAQYALGVVVAGDGYPKVPKKGMELDFIGEMDLSIYHGGTKKEGDHFIANGGRIFIGVVVGDSLGECRKKVYREYGKINDDSLKYRKDIGKL